MKTSPSRSGALGIVTLGLLVTFATAGCTPGLPAPSPTVTSSAGASTAAPIRTAPATSPSTASPDAGAAAGALAARIVIFSGLIGAVDASESSIGLIDMFEPVSALGPVVDEVSGYFGFEPIVEFRQADPSGDGFDYTSYVWDGFEILDFDYPASRVPARPEFAVKVNASDVRGVRVESIDGASIGDSMTELEGMFPADSYRQGGQFGPEIVVRIGVMNPVEGRFAPVRFAVSLTGPVGGGVEEIFSPHPDLQI